MKYPPGYWRRDTGNHLYRRARLPIDKSSGSIIDTRNLGDGFQNPTVASLHLSVEILNLSIDTQSLIVEVRSPNVDTQKLSVDTQRLIVKIPNLSVASLNINDESSTLTVASRSLNRHPGPHSAGLSGFFFAEALAQLVGHGFEARRRFGGGLHVVVDQVAFHMILPPVP